MLPAGETRKQLLIEIKTALDARYAPLNTWSRPALALYTIVGGSGYDGLMRYRRFTAVLNKAIEKPDAPGTITALVSAALAENWGTHSKPIVIPRILELIGIAKPPLRLIDYFAQDYAKHPDQEDRYGQYGIRFIEGDWQAYINNLNKCYSAHISIILAQEEKEYHARLREDRRPKYRLQGDYI